MAERRGLPALRDCRTRQKAAIPADQAEQEASRGEASSRLVEMLCLPEAVHGSRRLDFRGQPDPAREMAISHPPYVFVEEGDQQQPAKAGTWGFVSNGLVPNAPYPLRDGG